MWALAWLKRRVDLGLAVAAKDDQMGRNPRLTDPQRSALRALEDMISTARWPLTDATAGEIVAAYKRLLSTNLQDTDERLWTAAQLQLGHWLISAGVEQEDPEQLDDARRGFHDLWHFWETKDRVPYWADIVFRIANLVSYLAQTTHNVSDWHLAEQSFHRLSLSPHHNISSQQRTELDAALWACHYNLGVNYFDLGDDSKDKRLAQLAVSSFKSALRTQSCGDSPKDWLITQQGLTRALELLHDLSGDLSLLRECVQESQILMSKRMALADTTIDWAVAQKRLGNSLHHLGVKTANIPIVDEGLKWLGAALKEFPRETDPLDWSSTLNDIGNALYSKGTMAEDRSAFLDSIAAFKSAQEVRTLDGHPQIWLTIQKNKLRSMVDLGRTTHDRTLLAEAVSTCEDLLQQEHEDPHIRRHLAISLLALADGSPESEPFRKGIALLEALRTSDIQTQFPYIWDEAHIELASAQMDVGGVIASQEALSNARVASESLMTNENILLWAQCRIVLGDVLAHDADIQGRKEEFLEAAHAYSDAQGVLSRDHFPNRWAILQERKIAALLVFAEGVGSVDVLKGAIADLLQVLAPSPADMDQDTWVRTHINLTRSYMLWYSLDGDTSHLESAKRYISILLQHSPTEDSRAFARIHSCAGRLWQELAEAGVEGGWLERAYAEHTLALSVVDRMKRTDLWAAVKEAFALCLAEMGTINRDLSRLREAIDVYRDILSERRIETDPSGWAETNLNLAMAMIELGHLAVDPNVITEAIRISQETLTVMTKERSPRGWATLQSNIGLAQYYLGSFLHDPTRLTDAVQALDASLQVRTFALMPYDWASTQENIGLTLTRLGVLTGEVTFVLRAVDALRSALMVRTQQRLPSLWAQTQANLGNAFRFAFERTRSRSYALEAVTASRSVFVDCSSGYNPIVRANAGVCLASVLTELSTVSTSSNDLDEAIGTFEAVIAQLTGIELPLVWVSTQGNYGDALILKWRQAQQDCWLDAAIDAYRKALQIARPERMPLDFVIFASRLADALAEKAEWNQIVDLLSVVLEFAVPLVVAEATRLRQHRLLRCLTGIGDLLAYAYLKIGDSSAAVLAVDRGRSVRLTDALRIEGLPNEAEIRAARTAWSIARQVEQVQWEMGVQRPPARLAEVESAKGQVDVMAAFLRFRELLDQSLQGPMVRDVRSIVASVPKDTALAVVIVTEFGGAVIVLTSNSTRPQTLFLDGLTTATVLNIVAGPSNRTAWFNAYDRFKIAIQTVGLRRADLLALSMAMRETLRAIGRLLLSPLHHRLVELFEIATPEVIFVLPGWLSFLPVHAGVISTGEGDRAFLDYWIVSYVPSVAAFISSRQRANERQSRKPTLLAVTNPTKDLPILKNPALSAFPSEATLALDAESATHDAVCRELPGKSHLSFYCHGKWEPFNDEQSALILANGRPLSIAEIRMLDLTSSLLAVLAGCETGLVDIRNIDEMVGFPSALLEAGVPCVVASLWAVDAVWTEALIQRFFAIYQSGASPARALRQAQIELRYGHHQSANSCGNEASGLLDPLYWAAFTVTGGW
jgi:tetratricopeptide (TPR) repeat protein